MKVLVTGAAGFIGFHVSQQLLERLGPLVILDACHQYPSSAPTASASCIVARTPWSRVKR